MTDYPSAPVTGVGAVVWKGDEILLVRRANPPRAGSWTLPGGKQRLGETVYEAVMREIREETGVMISILDVAAVVDLMDHAPDGRLRYHYTVIDVAAEWVAGTAVAGDDAAEVTWANKSRFGELALTDDVIRVVAIAAAKRHL